MNEINIIELKLDICQGTFDLVLNLWILVIFIVLFFIIRFLIRIFFKSGKIHKQIKPIKFKYSFGGQEIEYEIKRDYQNVEIAHRIYVELITRKAALPIDEKHDVIVEIYDSWYTLFQTTREELKSLSGELLLNNDVSNDLTRLLTDILNKGLRPHLTEYQAKFRKWYTTALSDTKNNNLSPQQIQTQYENYSDLINSMGAVNQLLIKYAESLKEIARGTNT